MRKMKKNGEKLRNFAKNCKKLQKNEKKRDRLKTQDQRPKTEGVLNFECLVLSWGDWMFVILTAEVAKAAEVFWTGLTGFFKPRIPAYDLRGQEDTKKINHEWTRINTAFCFSHRARRERREM